MSFLKNLIGPSQNEIWGIFAQEIGAEYQPYVLFKRGFFKYKYKNWEFVLDTFSTGGENSQTYTRLRVPIKINDEIDLQIYNEHFFHKIGKSLGMQDVEVGDAIFDEKFIVKTNRAQKIKFLLSDADLKEKFYALKSVSLKLIKKNGFFSKSFPDKVNILNYEQAGIINNTDELRNMFQLFESLLDRMVEISMISEEKPDFILKT